METQSERELTDIEARARIFKPYDSGSVQSEQKGLMNAFGHLLSSPVQEGEALIPVTAVAKFQKLHLPILERGKIVSLVA